MKKQKATEKVAVLLTTDQAKRGVFMGLIDPQDMDKENIVAEEVRMAVYWSEDMKGVLGLASMGPSKDCRISRATTRALIKGVTAVVELSDEALKNWRLEPWS